ncbi:hypothetical protein NKJ13_21120 [Mesorhizobium sp. M0174]|uniref:hypothetical protein n=1 Tax=Mesorhizobium sp. M0174 TaxID=2956904 RepID=UPI003335CE4B
MPFDWPKRIRTRASRLPHGEALLILAEESETLPEMRRLIVNGEKPVTAFSGEMIERFGEAEAQHHPLRQLAGEVAAYLVESQLGAVRASGSRNIVDDPVFSSGTPFRIPGAIHPAAAAAGPLATELLVRHLSNLALASLANIIAAEEERRLAA